MGTERGTPVLNSDIYLSSLDLPDLRLPRVFQAWTDFRIAHQQRFTALETLAPAELTWLTVELSRSMSRTLGTEVVSSVSNQKVAQLVDAVSGNGNRIIFMRHGEQSSPERVCSISDPRLRKIRMMQDPFNKEDLLTNKGLVDVFVTAFSLLYVTETTGKRLNVLSSENLRAKEVAGVVARVIPSTTFATNEGLNCITYRDERDVPPATIEGLLEDLPAGFMPWNPALIDKWCKKTRSGIRPSEAIIRTIAALMRLGTKIDGDELFLVSTHNQQLAEALRLKARLENPFMRFPELTMIVVRDKNDLTIFPRGVLSQVKYAHAMFDVL
ncbi:hypothetical protein HYW41_04870 [Candidatus Daviesbacteria bacterium]|nr:hypothetical protein [Candidatus Daviesbacteria bacterium]